MDEQNVMLLTDEQQRLYVDALFAMAALDGFEITGTTGGDDGRPVCCAKQIGKYWVEISAPYDDNDKIPDASKAAWEVEVNEGMPEEPGTTWKIHQVYVALHAGDALRIAKGLVRFYDTLKK